MNDIDLQRLVLGKLNRTNVPVVTLAPQFSMSPKEWVKFMGLIYSVVSKVEDKTNQSFIVDIQDALWSQKRKNECEESPDGYHHIIEWENEKIAGAIFCIHCGELFVKCNLSPEELREHLIAKGWASATQPIAIGSKAEKADVSPANTD